MFAAILGLTVAVAPARSQRPDTTMAGMRTGMMGMGHDSTTMAQMGVIHELIMNHDRVRRTVTNLPDGIRTVTESDDPRLAMLIRTHVASMDQRVKTGDDPGLPMESEAVHSIFRDRDKIRTTTELTANGVVVVQTSTDPKTVAVLQQHAAEVSDLVRGGMAALRAAMMKNGGGMMMHDMHDMNGGMPNSRDTTRAPARPE